MKDATLGIQQIKEIASKLQVKEYMFSYVSDVDQLLITIRESDEVLKKLKGQSQLILECSYLKDLDVFAFYIYLDMHGNVPIVAACDPREDLIKYLEKIINGHRSIEFIIVGEDLNLISVRQCFDSETGKMGVSHALKQYKNRNGPIM